MPRTKKGIVVTGICVSTILILLLLIFSEKKMSLLLPKVNDTTVCMIILEDQPAISKSVYVSDRENVEKIVNLLGELKISFLGIKGKTIYVTGMTYRLIFGEGNSEAGELTVNGDNVYSKNFCFKMTGEDAAECRSILSQLF